MLKLTFDGTKFRDDQGREVVNPEEIMEGLAIIKTDGKIEWPYGFEVVHRHPIKFDMSVGHHRRFRVNCIKLIHPSERANYRHEKSKQLFKEFLNSEEAKEIIGTMKDEKLTPEQGSELVEIYKKAGWYADEANKECPYCAPDGTIRRDGSLICPHCKGSHFIVEEANKNDMKDFKKFTTLEETPTTATNSTEAKPERGEITPIEVLAEYFHINVEAIQKDLNAKMTLSEVIELIEHLSLTKVEAKPEPTKVRIIESDLAGYAIFDEKGKLFCSCHLRKDAADLIVKAVNAYESQPSPSEELIKDSFDARDNPEKWAVEVFKNDSFVVTIENYRRQILYSHNLSNQLTASESRVKELEERIEALLDNHGLTNAKIKQIAAEERVKELETLAIRLSELLQDSNKALQMDCDVGMYDFTEDNELIAKAKALKP